MPRLKKTFRWGLVGPGRIAHRFAAALEVVKDAELYAVASRDLARAQAFAGTYQAPKAYSDYQALLADPKVDAVYIATPHRFHFEQSMAALEAGKPVLCEKPLTVNAVQAQILVQTARLRGVFLMEALWTRFLPVFREVREWLDQGFIGQTRLLTSTFGIKAELDPQSRLYNAQLAGGALLDLGVYNLSMSQWVYGRNAEYFSAQSLMGETGVDELTTVDLIYEDGAASQFTCTIKAQTENDFNIYGDEGRIRLEPRFWEATTATLTTDYQTLTLKRPFRATGLEYEIEEVMHCVRHGEIESPDMSHVHSLGTMAFLDKIRGAVGLRYPFE